MFHSNHSSSNGLVSRLGTLGTVVDAEQFDPYTYEAVELTLTEKWCVITKFHCQQSIDVCVSLLVPSGVIFFSASLGFRIVVCRAPMETS